MWHVLSMMGVNLSTGPTSISSLSHLLANCHRSLQQISLLMGPLLTPASSPFLPNPMLSYSPPFAPAGSLLVHPQPPVSYAAAAPPHLGNM
jgi:hypothetical protein